MYFMRRGPSPASSANRRQRFLAPPRGRWADGVADVHDHVVADARSGRQATETVLRTPPGRPRPVGRSQPDMRAGMARHMVQVSRGGALKPWRAGAGAGRHPGLAQREAGVAALRTAPLRADRAARGACRRCAHARQHAVERNSRRQHHGARSRRPAPRPRTRPSARPSGGTRPMARRAGWRAVTRQASSVRASAAPGSRPWSRRRSASGARLSGQCLRGELLERDRRLGLEGLAHRRPSARRRRRTSGRRRW